MKRLSFILLILATGVASAQDMPKNAHSNQFAPQGWSCNSGYKQQGGACQPYLNQQCKS